MRVIAHCSDQAPHFGTIAHFVSTLSHERSDVFAAVVTACDAQGLIGREMFAIDVVKLLSTPSKHRSGTREEFVRQNEKFKPAAQVTVQRGPKGTVLQGKGNRTVNHSATMATSNGVIHGDTGVAAVDAHTQIVVVAQAHATHPDHELLVPVVDALAPVLTPDALVTADAGYHSEAACQVPEVRAIHALLADNAMRQRDERCAIADHVCCTRIDTPDCRAQYGRRFATVKPVLANLRHNKRLTHFTVRGRTKVEAHWQLFCLVPYIEKLAHNGYAAYGGAVRAGVTLRLQRLHRKIPHQQHSVAAT